MFALSFPVSGLWVKMSLQRRRFRAWHSWWESERRLKQVSTVDSPPIRLGRLSLPTASVWNQLPRCILLFILFQDQECHLHIYMCDGFFHPISFFWALHPSAHDSWHISCVVVWHQNIKKKIIKNANIWICSRSSQCERNIYLTFRSAQIFDTFGKYHVLKRKFSESKNIIHCDNNFLWISKVIHLTPKYTCLLSSKWLLA